MKFTVKFDVGYLVPDAIIELPREPERGDTIVLNEDTEGLECSLNRKFTVMSKTYFQDKEKLTILNVWT